ncbi:MAG TPA: TIR domain-containing protein, partial [Bryobacteraceae bacterium]|nr:TIR domain-containing protein [Bryobacteraceae bacterium]
QLMGAADIVLIDSRTGVAEMSGVCTRQLADVVVCLCAPNDQNLDGVEMMARSFQRDELVQARGRPIQLIMAEARLDLSEGRPVDLFEGRFREKLNKFAPDLFNRLGVFFTKLRIPYIKEYAFSEQMVIGDPEGVKSLQEAYVTLAAHIAALAPGNSAVRRQCREVLRNTFGLPTVYIALIDAQEKEFSQKLSSRLEDAGTITLPVEVGTTESGMWMRGAWETSGPTSALVMVIGQRTLRDDRARRIWEAARERGVCLYFVLAGLDADALERPRWTRRLKLYDTASEWETLVATLQSPCPGKRVPMMAPVLVNPLIGRDQELGKLKDVLLGGASRAIAVLGAPGIGKTALARAVCHDEDVIDAFDGGILWASLAGENDARAAAASMLTALTGDAAVDSTLDDTTRKLSDALSRRHCLIVFDELTEAGQLGRLRDLGGQSRLLLTSRVRGLARELEAYELELGPLDSAGGVALLLSGTKSKPGTPSVQAAALAEELGNVPVALELANRALKGGADIEALAQGVQSQGLETVVVGSSATSLFGAYAMMLERLSAPDRARLPLLGDLPAGTSLPLKAIASALDLSAADSARLMRTLASMSVVEFDEAKGTVLIPAIASQYFKSLRREQKRAEAQTVTSADGSRRMPLRDGILISYTREDSAGYAGRLYDRLRALGRDRIFMDVDSIRPGDDFVDAIRRMIDACSVALVLMGPKWLSKMRESTFLMEELRRLVTEAGRGTIRVIPVLVGGATMPSGNDLPVELQPLSRFNAFQISDVYFQRDVDRLVDIFRQLESSGPQVAAAASSSVSQSRRNMLTVVVGAMMVLAGIAAWVFWPRAHPGLVPPNVQSAPPEFTRAEQYYYARDFPEAAQLYEKAADLGYVPAMNRVGRLYELGQGVPRDFSQAKQWYQKAASAGNLDAQAALNALSTWTVVIATDKDLKYSKQWVDNLKGLGFAASIYLRDEKYVTGAGSFRTESDAESAATSLRPKTRPDAHPVDLTKWCASSTVTVEENQPVFVCAGPRKPL